MRNFFKKVFNVHNKAKEELLTQAKTLYDLERYEEALAAYEQAILLNKGDTDFLAIAYGSKGSMLYDLERYEEALAAYDQALVHDPDSDADTYLSKGETLTALGRHDEAQQAYQKAKEREAF